MDAPSLRSAHFLRDSSPSAVVAGFIAMLTGYTSSLVLMFQAGQNAGLSAGQISSWIWALSIGMALCCIGLSLRYRALVMIAWSTPGAALLISSLPGFVLAYPLGGIKWQEMRARAEKALGDRFDVRAFHQVLLEDGMLPFAALDAKLDRWIASQ